MSGIVVLADVIVPDEVIQAGISGVQNRVNSRTRNQGGFVDATVVRDVTLRGYQIGIHPMELDLWLEIEGIYENTDAGAYGMLLEDPKDSTVTPAQGALSGFMSGVQFGAIGFGNGTPDYVLQKLYRVAARTRARDIYRPKGTPAITRGGTPVVVGAAPGNVALTAGPVRVTFVPDATRTVDAVAVGATTQVTLSTAITGLVVGGRLWLQGLPGADAALLNDKSHEITNIASGVYTLATNTAGKAITAGGQGHKYPQPDEALTWAGSFYTPVHFRDDTLDWDMVASGPRETRLIQGPAIYLDEVREL